MREGVFSRADGTPGILVEDRGFSLAFYDATGRHRYGYQVMKEQIVEFAAGATPDNRSFALDFGNIERRMLVVKRRGDEIIVCEQIHGQTAMMANGQTSMPFDAHAFDAWRASILVAPPPSERATLPESLHRPRA